MGDEQVVRSAGVRRADRLASGATTAETVRRTKSNEIESTHRVYVKDWLINSRHSTAEDAARHASANLSGRVWPDDQRITEDFDGTWLLETRLWNVSGEWKTEELADSHARALRESGVDEVETVARNSRREHVLAQYGVLMLPVTSGES